MSMSGNIMSVADDFPVSMAHRQEQISTPEIITETDALRTTSLTHPTTLGQSTSFGQPTSMGQPTSLGQPTSMGSVGKTNGESMRNESFPENRTGSLLDTNSSRNRSILNWKSKKQSSFEKSSLVMTTSHRVTTLSHSSLTEPSSDESSLEQSSLKKSSLGMTSLETPSPVTTLLETPSLEKTSFDWRGRHLAEKRLKKKGVYRSSSFMTKKTSFSTMERTSSAFLKETPLSIQPLAFLQRSGWWPRRNDPLNKVKRALAMFQSMVQPQKVLDSAYVRLTDHVCDFLIKAVREKYGSSSGMLNFRGEIQSAKLSRADVGGRLVDYVGIPEAGTKSIRGESFPSRRKILSEVGHELSTWMRKGNVDALQAKGTRHELFAYFKEIMEKDEVYTGVFQHGDLSHLLKDDVRDPQKVNQYLEGLRSLDYRDGSVLAGSRGSDLWLSIRLLQNGPNADTCFHDATCRDIFVRLVFIYAERKVLESYVRVASYAWAAPFVNQVHVGCPKLYELIAEWKQDTSSGVYQWDSSSGIWQRDSSSGAYREQDSSEDWKQISHHWNKLAELYRREEWDNFYEYFVNTVFEIKTRWPWAEPEYLEAAKQMLPEMREKVWRDKVRVYGPSAPVVERVFHLLRQDLRGVDYGSIYMAELLCHFVTNISRKIKTNEEKQSLVQFLVKTFSKQDIQSNLVAVTNNLPDSFFTFPQPQCTKRVGMLESGMHERQGIFVGMLENVCEEQFKIGFPFTE